MRVNTETHNKKIDICVKIEPNKYIYLQINK